MKAIALTTGTTNLRLVDRPEPQIRRPDEIKIQVLQVGICGTDREEASGGRADAPRGEKELIIGHEMVGRVTATGPGVKKFREGDHVVLSVRRGCGRCPACLQNRSDMCSTGGYTERGIKGAHGYQAETVVDQESYAVKIPPELAALGVLTEPMSVAEKAIDEAVSIQAARLPDGHGPPWLKGKRALVAGMGAVGLLAAVALRLRGANVLLLGRHDPGEFRPSVVPGLGAKYIDDRRLKPENWGEQLGQIDLIVEAAGSARLEFDLLSALGINGIYVLTGIPGGERTLQVEGAELMRRLVLRNQVMVGSVNASPKHFQMAVEDLGKAQQAWGEVMSRFIGRRFPYSEFSRALSYRAPDSIKTVVEWAEP